MPLLLFSNPHTCLFPSSSASYNSLSSVLIATPGNSERSGESKDEVVPVDKLPLESKLQERMEQKIKMKMAKKTRLCRNRLLRKGRMRKKGRWPPSKMKKLKNV